MAQVASFLPPRGRPGLGPTFLAVAPSLGSILGIWKMKQQEFCLSLSACFSYTYIHTYIHTPFQDCRNMELKDKFILGPKI